MFEGVLFFKLRRLLAGFLHQMFRSQHANSSSGRHALVDRSAKFINLLMPPVIGCPAVSNPAAGCKYDDTIGDSDTGAQQGCSLVIFQNRISANREGRLWPFFTLPHADSES